MKNARCPRASGNSGRNRWSPSSRVMIPGRSWTRRDLPAGGEKRLSHVGAAVMALALIGFALHLISALIGIYIVVLLVAICPGLPGPGSLRTLIGETEGANDNRWVDWESYSNKQGTNLTIDDREGKIIRETFGFIGWVDK